MPQNNKLLRSRAWHLRLFPTLLLGLLAAEWLFVSRQGCSEGDLSREKAYLISEPVLARHGAALENSGCGVNRHLRPVFGHDPRMSDALAQGERDGRHDPHRHPVAAHHVEQQGVPRLEPLIEGTARYSKFRRFQVKTAEKVVIPK